MRVSASTVQMPGSTSPAGSPRASAIPWIADFRDPALQPLNRVAAAIHKPWLRGLLRSASATVNVNPYWAALDQRDFNRPAECLPNGFDPDESFSPRSPTRSMPVHVVYIGNILRPYQRIELFLDGMVTLRTTDSPASRAVRFTYIGATADEIQRLVTERGLNDVVDLVPRVERRRALEIAAAADVLLVLGAVAPPGDRWYAKGVVPGKTFEYLGLRKPILCVPGDRGVLEQVLLETRAGTVCNEAPDIARYLEAAVRTKSHGGALEFDPDLVAVARYSRRALAGRLATILNRCVDESRPAAGV